MDQIPLFEFIRGKKTKANHNNKIMVVIVLWIVVLKKCDTALHSMIGFYMALSNEHEV